MKLSEYVNSGRGLSAKLARELKVVPVIVSQWVCDKRQVPAERCPEIERLTNGKVTCEELRPDVNWSVLRNSAIHKLIPAKPSCDSQDGDERESLSSNNHNEQAASASS